MSDTQAKLDTIPNEPLAASDVMSRPVYTCQPDTALSAVAKLMWHHDCGLIPVVDASERIVGVITHGDIAIARETRRLLPELISAAQAMVVTIHSCLPDASVSDVLATMKRFGVQRLPVIDSHRRPQGVVSISDIVRAMARGHSLNVMEIVLAMAAIGLSVPTAVTMKSPLVDRDPVRVFRTRARSSSTYGDPVRRAHRPGLSGHAPVERTL